AEQIDHRDRVVVRVGTHEGRELKGIDLAGVDHFSRVALQLHARSAKRAAAVLRPAGPATAAATRRTAVGALLALHAVGLAARGLTLDARGVFLAVATGHPDGFFDAPGLLHALATRTHELDGDFAMSAM